MDLNDSDDDSTLRQAIRIVKGSRVFVPPKTKVLLCEQVIRERATNPSFSLKEFCRTHRVQGQQIRRLIKRLPALKDSAMAPGKTKLTLHKGPRSSLEEADVVVQWVRKLRHNGMPVSMNMAILKASQLNGQFHRKSSTAKYAVICRIR